MTDFMNEYCMHTATCGELRKGDVGREVVLCGWAWHNLSLIHISEPTRPY